MSHALSLIALFFLGPHIPQSRTSRRFLSPAIAVRPMLAYETARRRAGRTVTRRAIAASEEWQQPRLGEAALVGGLVTLTLAASAPESTGGPLWNVSKIERAALGCAFVADYRVYTLGLRERTIIDSRIIEAETDAEAMAAAEKLVERTILSVDWRAPRWADQG
jgi:hypothetical protein